MRISEPLRTAAGYVAKALPLHKWRRPDGLSSFLADMIALRKTLSLCHSCETGKMPRRWMDRYDYSFVRGFSIDLTACDLCRQHAACNMYVAVEGRYARQLDEERRLISALRERERRRLNEDSRYVIGL